MKLIIMSGVLLCVFFMIGCSGTRPSALGLKTGSLAPCPEKPNCVTSMSADSKHLIEPFSYTTTKSMAFQALKRLLLTQERTTVVEETDNYLYVEFKTRCFRFVDDVEFYFPEDELLIHVRSASRLGYSDMGLNRKRMEGIRTQFMKTLEEH